MSDIKVVRVRHGFERERVAVKPVGESLTQQSMAAETDINRIMKRYEKTGLLEHVNNYQGDYGDFTAAVDYHTALNQVMAARDMFMSLPASIRGEFANDPGLFLDFVEDPANRAKMEEMGLVPVKQDATEGTAEGGSQEPSPSTGPEGDPVPSQPPEGGEGGGTPPAT
mgnify:CR=1 FL=1